MPQFQYTAVNNSGKKLNGVIGAVDENEARKQLNTFGISVLGIKKTKELAGASPKSTEPTIIAGEELDTFEFEAFDKNGRKVLGSIPADNRYKAFKRLMDEYKFEVSYVVKMGASPEEKEKAKLEDLTALRAEYDEKHKSKVEKKIMNADFEEKKAALLSKVDSILEKIKALLAQYDADIKPESKQQIQKYIDKLLRIKSSTNLDYIEQTSEELLKKIQGQELFLHKEKMSAERDKLKLETQKMMANLHRKSSDKKDVMDELGNLQGKLIKSKYAIFKQFGKILKPFALTPKEKDLKKQIRTVNKQVWSFRKIWLTANKGTKSNAYKSLQKIIDERNRKKLDFKTLHEKNKEVKEGQVHEPLIAEEVMNFLGWLLGFYLVAYFFSYYVFAKAFPKGNPLPGDFNLLESSMLRTLLISFFLWYVLLHLRIQYLRYQNWANAVIIPLGIVINASLILNL